MKYLCPNGHITYPDDPTDYLFRCKECQSLVNVESAERYVPEVKVGENNDISWTELEKIQKEDN